MSDKIYLVFVSEYDRIGNDKFVKVFRSKENAEKYLNSLNKRGYIEEAEIED